MVKTMNVVKHYIKNQAGEWVLITPTTISLIGKSLPFNAPNAPSPDYHKSQFRLFKKHPPLTLEDCFYSSPVSTKRVEVEPSMVERMRRAGVSEEQIQLFIEAERR